MYLSEKYLECGKNYYPTWATWEVTSRCNAKCEYCYLGKSKNAIEDIETKRMFEIADKLYESGALFLTLTGGEPFIRRDILSILKYIIQKDFFSVTIFSNGSLITEKHVQFLKDYNKYIKNIQFSVFSHLPEINDAYFGIKDALKNTLFWGKQLLSCDIPVTFAFNVFDFNVRESKNTKKIFMDMGFSVRTSFYKLLLDQEHEKLLTSNISKDFYMELLNNSSQSSIKSLKQRLTDNNKEPPDSLCSGLFTNIAIDCAGNILPCISFRKLSLGSVFQKQSIHDILASSRNLKYVRSLGKKDIKTCAHCIFLDECSFCLGMMHTRNNDLTEPFQQYCTFFNALEKHSCIE